MQPRPSWTYMPFSTLPPLADALDHPWDIVTHKVSPRMCFQMSCKGTLKKNFSHWLHWYCLPIWWVIMWCLKIICCNNALSYLLHLYDFSPECVLKCILRLLFCEKPCHIGCINMVSPQCVSSCDLLNCSSMWNPCHIGCTDMVSPQDVFSNA